MPAPRTHESCVHILYTLSGNHSGFLSEFIISLKSVLMNSPLDANLTVHVMADNPAYIGLKSLWNETNLNEWITRNQITIHVHDIETEISHYKNVNNETIINAIYHHLSNFNESFVRTKRFHTIGALFRLFPHYLLDTNIHHILYLDTDVLMLNNLAEVWKYRDNDKVFQWGERSKCSGFLLINLKRFRNDFWNLSKTLLDANKRRIYGDQELFRFFNNAYPHLVSYLPPEWDAHYDTAWRDQNSRKRTLMHYPRPCFIHLNGGAKSKKSAFEVHHLVTSNKFSIVTTWGIGKYYVNIPWEWARFHLKTQVNPSHEGHLIMVDYA